jgi:hypothetical protein
MRFGCLLMAASAASHIHLMRDCFQVIGIAARRHAALVIKLQSFRNRPDK